MIVRRTIQLQEHGVPWLFLQGPGGCRRLLPGGMGCGFREPLDLLASLGFDRLAAPWLCFLPPTKIIERSPFLRVLADCRICELLCRRLVDLFVDCSLSPRPTVVAANDTVAKEAAVKKMKASEQSLIRFSLCTIWSPPFSEVNLTYSLVLSQINSSLR
jgi:hypothetical protein